MDKTLKINDFESLISAHQAELKEAFDRVTHSGWFILGQEVQSFEQEFAQYIGVKHCIGVANGLEALQISLMGLGIGKGDEVITTPLSAAATTIAIMAVGATPVFADTDSNGNLNPSRVESLVTKKTKAILPVHLYGQPGDLNKFIDLCREHNLFLLEDACQAHGSTYQNKRLGSFGKAGCFSFYPTKNLGALGDGGAIVTDDNDLAEVFRQIRDYGQSSKYHHVRYGLNSRLDEIQAAFLKVFLKTLDSRNSKRKYFARLYIKELKDVEIVTTDIDNSNFHQFVIRVKQRDEFIEYLKGNGISTNVLYPSLIPDQSFIKYQSTFENAHQLSREVLSLPIDSYLSEQDIHYIIIKVRDFFK